VSGPGTTGPPRRGASVALQARPPCSTIASMSQSIARTDDELLSVAAGLPVGPCPSCEREVIAYLLEVEDAARGGSYACVHCDGPVKRVEWIDERDLEQLGYSVNDPFAAGCATGCARGGCSARGAPRS